MENTPHPMTECMIGLIMNTLAKSEYADAISKNETLITFYLSMFLDDYETKSLTIAADNIASAFGFVMEEHRERKENGDDPEIIRSLARHGVALGLIGQTLQQMNVVLDGDF